MYVPAHFRLDDPDETFAFMERHAFATLVTCVDGTPFATHLPLLVERGDGGGAGVIGRLRGHVARANPHWRSFEAAGEALAIFQGPHAYVSPSWYEGEENVPTWNYAAVHAYGKPRVIDDARELRALLRALVAREERGFAVPWEMDRLSESYLTRMMGGIVGFEIPIARLEGKYKLSQNRPLADRVRVAAALSGADDQVAREVGALMTAMTAPTD